MAVELSMVFVGTLLLALLAFFWLSGLLMAGVDVAGFGAIDTELVDVKYLIRYVITSILAGFTGLYIFVHNHSTTGGEAVSAAFISVAIWAVILVLLDLFAVETE